jgi:uncharacterized protein
MSVVFVLPYALFAFDIPTHPSAYVNDYAGVLSQDTKVSLEQKLTELNASTTNEVTVVIVPSLEGKDTIEGLGIKIADTWKVGKKGRDNGVLFLISRDDHEARIEVGYGLEGSLTDSVSGQILRDVAFPSFKKGDYNQGVVDGVDAIIQVIQGEQFTSPVTPSSSFSFDPKLIEFALVFLFGAIAFIARLLASTKSWWQGGVLGLGLGAVLGVIFTTGIFILVISLVFGLFGLIVDYILSKHGPFSGGGGGGIFPIFFGGSGGGRSGGFDGFGGGGFGGGGASGKW